MKVRTLDQLFDWISGDRVWRIREIAALRGQCYTPRLSPEAQRALRRSFVPIAYAHWEGFVKKSSHYYLEFVAMQRLRLCDLSLPFASMYLMRECRSSLSMTNSFALTEVCRMIVERAEDRVQLPYRDIVPTRSNLNSEVLKNICNALGLDYEGFQTKEIFLDAKLLGKRNHIAHGETQDVDQDELDLIKDEVVGLIDAFRSKIENAATNGEFRRL